jgi:hypothetical protein
VIFPEVPARSRLCCSRACRRVTPHALLFTARKRGKGPVARLATSPLARNWGMTGRGVSGRRAAKRRTATTGHPRRHSPPKKGNQDDGGAEDPRLRTSTTRRRRRAASCGRSSSSNRSRLLIATYAPREGRRRSRRRARGPMHADPERCSKRSKSPGQAVSCSWPHDRMLLLTVHRAASDRLGAISLG